MGCTTLKLSGTVGAAKEGETRRAWARAVGEGMGVSLKESEGYGDLTEREAGGEVMSHRKNNFTGTTYGSSLVPIIN